jgi:hypothetical protein
VFTIAQLEPVRPPQDDPYHRPRPTKPATLDASQNLWEVDRLLNKRVITKGRGFATEYLVRWTGYGSIDDMWINIKNLEGCQEAIKEYEDEMGRFANSVEER